MDKTKTCPECGVALVPIRMVFEDKILYGCPECRKTYLEEQAEALNGGQ